MLRLHLMENPMFSPRHATILLALGALMFLWSTTSTALGADEEPQLTRKYDRFQDQTTVSLTVLIERSALPPRVHVLLVMVTFEGKEMPPLDELDVVVGWQTVGKQWLFRDRRDGLRLALLAHDDEPEQRDPEPVREAWPVIEYDPQLERAGRLLMHKETLAFAPTTVAQWEKLLSKAHLELQLGGFETSFNKRQLGGLRRFIKRLKKDQQ